MYKKVKKTYEIGESSHKSVKQERLNSPKAPRLSQPIKGRKECVKKGEAERERDGQRCKKAPAMSGASALKRDAKRQ